MKHIPVHKFKPVQRRGSVVALAAICLVVVLAFMVFAIDYGYIVVSESDLQNAADAGALSGARALVDGRPAAIAAAKTWAGKNLAAGEHVILTDADVEIGKWNDSTASFVVLSADSPETPNAVRVTCRRSTEHGNPLRLFFAPMFGTEHANLTVMATAALENDRCGMIVGLDFVNIANGQTDSYNSDLGSYQSQTPGQNGDVCSDGPITIQPVGLVMGDARPGNGYSIDRPENVTGSTTPRNKPIRWKPIDMTGVDDNNNYSIPSRHINSNGRLRLSGSQSLTLDPGLYYFPGGINLSGTAQINVTGPTRIVVGGTSNIAGRGIVNSSSIPKNLRIDVIGSSFTLHGTSAIHADIYGPTANIDIDGNAGFFGAIFGKSVSMSGNASNIHGDEVLRREIDQHTARSVLKQ